MRVFFSITVLLLHVNCFSQFERLLNYNVKDGLPSSDTYDVTQDSKGYIWVIGDLGVSRFDGYKFTNYSIEDGLADNTTFGTFEDGKRRIWFRSLSGKLSYYKNDSIYTIPCNDSLAKIFRYVVSYSFHVDAGDTIWIGVASNFYIKILPGWTEKDIRKIEMRDGKYMLMLDKTNMIFGGYHKGIMDIHVYGKQGKVGVINTGVINNSTQEIRLYITRLKNGDYIASVGKKILRFSLKGVLSSAEEQFQIISITEDSDGTLLISGYNGLFVYSLPELKRIKPIRMLANKIVTRVYIGRENEAWISTEGHGLYCAPHRNFKYYTTDDGLSDSKISFIKSFDSIIVSGHLNGTINILKADTILSIVHNEPNETSQVRRVTSILEYDGKILITKMVGGYYLSQSRLQPLPQWTKVAVKRVIKDRNGNLLIVDFSYLSGLDPKNNFKVLFRTKIPARTDNVFEDSERRIWISGVDGVYNYYQGSFQYLGAINKLFKYRPTDFCEAPDKSIWITTRGGGVLHKQGDRVTQISLKDGLAGNMCRAVICDSNIIWVGTNKGLSRIISSNGSYSITNYNSNTGLLTNDVNLISKHKNVLLLAHNNGITVFPNKNINNLSTVPRMYIENASINDSIYKGNNITLNHNQNHVTINYVGLYFKEAGNLEYKYKMYGLDTNWIYTRYTSAKYQGLQPGAYKFEVLAKNNAGVWSEPALFEFVIEPAWWQTWLFRILILSVMMLVVALIVKKYYTFVRKREEEKLILHKRIAQTELQALRAQMNPHFVFNAINSVQYFITRNDPESSQKYLSKFAKLIRYVVDNSKPAHIPLKTEIDALTLYLELEALRFENKFEYSITISPEVNVNNIQIPSMLIQPYVENAIWHGLMHKKGNGKIEISFDIQQNKLSCVIEDDGIGRKKSIEINKAAALNLHKSMGMNITKERLEIINHIHKTNLDFAIMDILDAQSEIAGTRVTLNIPLN